MNEIVSNLFLAGDKFMPDMHLNGQDLHIVLAVHWLNIKKELKNSKIAEDSRHIYQH